MDGPTDGRTSSSLLSCLVPLVRSAHKFSLRRLPQCLLLLLLLSPSCTSPLPQVLFRQKVVRSLSLSLSLSSLQWKFKCFSLARCFAPSDEDVLVLVHVARLVVVVCSERREGIDSNAAPLLLLPLLLLLLRSSCHASG